MIKPKPPEARFECGWCKRIVLESKFVDHECLPIKIGKLIGKILLKYWMR